MWVRVDDSVPHHPKFVQAGAAASWFWLCGNCYSSRYLTDGFIAEQCLSVLSPGANYKRFTAALVAAKLWDKVDGGYQIHDYHDYNFTADEHLRMRRVRAEAGKMGGIAKARALAKRQADATVAPLANDLASAKQDAKQNPSTCQPVLPTPSRPVPAREEEILEKHELAKKYPPSAKNADYEEFMAVYPDGRRVGGKIGRKAFENATAGRNGTHLAALHAALEQHKRSAQWQNPRLIPLMTTWLNQERWTQTLPEPEQPEIPTHRLTPFEQARRAGLK